MPHHRLPRQSRPAFADKMSSSRHDMNIYGFVSQNSGLFFFFLGDEIQVLVFEYFLKSNTNSPRLCKNGLSSVAQWICGRVQGSGHSTHGVHLFWAPPLGKHSARFHTMLKITLKVGILCTRKVKPGSAWWHPQGQKALRNAKADFPARSLLGPSAHHLTLEEWQTCCIHTELKSKHVHCYCTSGFFL